MPQRAVLARHAGTLGLVTAVLLMSASCDDPATPPPGAGDPENISRVTITLTPVGGGAPVVSFIVDADGTTLPDPPDPPSASLTLAKGVTYNGTITLLNDIDPDNVIQINDEVEEEADFHRFFFTITADTTGADSIGLPPFDASRDITIPVSSLNTDNQSPPQPLGTTFQVVVGGAAPTGTTTLNIQLHHFEADKGDGLGTVFDTDLNVNFPVSVQ
jgi:hypothetical protein